MSRDTNETIADILRKMREDVREICGPEDWEADQLTEYLRGLADSIAAAAERELSKNGSNNGPEIGQFAPKPDWGVHEALAFANTLANHGWTREANPDAASSCIYALCRLLRSPGSAAAMREALKRILAIEGYGAPWIEAKVIAQKALEGQQCTPPIAQETAKIEQPGNAAAMREALERIVEWADRYYGRLCFYGGSPEGDGWRTASRAANDALAQARSALSAPARNCDVGTAKEQTERFEAFCQGNMQYYKDMFGHDDEGRLDGWDCREDCPIGRMIGAGEAVSDHCQLAWAQMPYAPAEGGAE